MTPVSTGIFLLFKWRMPSFRKIMSLGYRLKDDSSGTGRREFVEIFLRSLGLAFALTKSLAVASWYKPGPGATHRFQRKGHHKSDKLCLDWR